MDPIWTIPEQIFGAPFGGDTSLFWKSQVMNKKVGIREAFHFEDEKNKYLHETHETAHHPIGNGLLR